MEVVVTSEQLAAIMGTRKTLSPGGTARNLGISRQRVIELYQHKRNDRGLLAWKVPFTTRLGFERHYVHIDFGPFSQLEMDQTEWRGQDPGEILRQSIREYAEIWARRAAAGE